MKGNGREAERLARATLLGVFLGVVLARLCRRDRWGSVRQAGLACLSR
ncbi:MAG: hypothetical protein ACRDIX_02385 [Actinomycetota bacterium]